MHGKRVIVTGAFGALGRDVCEALSARGARVAAIDVSQKAPDDLVITLGTQSVILGGVDLTRPADAARAVKSTCEAFGGIDVLVNVAGGFAWETHAEGVPATWDRLFALNVMTAANMIRSALPALNIADGRIVNVGAGSAVKAGAGMGAYAAAKSGVHRMTEALAEELKGRVAVNAVLPSIIDTPANRADMPDADFTTWVTTADLAAVILFLASDEARAVTGALVPVNGRV